MPTVALAKGHILCIYILKGFGKPFHSVVTKMLFTLILSIVIACVGFVSATAPPTFARADFVPGALGPLSGSVLFIAAGDGVIVSLEISGFPEEGGPWPYHRTPSRIYHLTQSINTLSLIITVPRLVHHSLSLMKQISLFLVPTRFPLKDVALETWQVNSVT